MNNTKPSVSLADVAAATGITFPDDTKILYGHDEDAKFSWLVFTIPTSKESVLGEDYIEIDSSSTIESLRRRTGNVFKNPAKTSKSFTFKTVGFREIQFDTVVDGQVVLVDCSVFK